MAQWNNLVVDGLPQDKLIGPPATELTIATGDVTPTKLMHRIDTEADAATDFLDGIVAGLDSQLLIIRAEAAARVPTVRHNQNAAATKNILLANGANVALSDPNMTLTLRYVAELDTNGAWVEIARAVGAPAVLSTTAPQPVDGTAAAAGSGTEASKDDHVHMLGPLTATLDVSQQQLDGARLENAASGPDAASEVVGQVYFDTALNRARIWHA